jgi:hypothetical protein
MMIASQVAYRNGIERIDPRTRTMRIVPPRSRRLWYVPHLALGVFIVTLWAADLVAHLYFQL